MAYDRAIAPEAPMREHVTINGLESQVARLSEEVQRLNMTIQPLLAPDVPYVTLAEGQDRPPQSRLEDLIETLADRITDLSRLTDRVTV